MYGDTKYEWVKSGSTAASAATAHLLFGAYNGLSLLNDDDVLNVQILAQNNPMELLPTVALSPGFPYFASGSTIHDLPAQSVKDVEELHFRNFTILNTTVYWNIWRRV